MNINHDLMGVVAGVVATIGFVPYTIATFKGPTVPSKASWTIWFLVGTALALSYKTCGGNAAMWLAISYAVCPFAVLVAIVWKSRGKKEKWPAIDKVCLKVGIALFVPWIVFKVLEAKGVLPSWGIILPAITLYGGIAVDASGAVATVLKTWKNPASENFWGWFFWTVGNLLNLLAVKTWSINEASYPVYMAIPSALILPALILYKLRGRMA